MTAKLTVAVVSYNTRELLAACLASVEAALERTPELAARVVVVDNASPDGSAAMVRERFPDVDLRALERNIGFPAACNVALRDLETPFALIVNADTELLADAPGVFVRFLERVPSAGVVGGRLVYPDGAFQHSAFRFPGVLQQALDLFPLHHRLTDSPLNGRYAASSYQSPMPIDHPLGACMALRRAALEQVGLFDEGYVMYSEEIDLCWRMRQAGWDVWYTPEATIVHHAGASTRLFRGEMMVRLHRSRLRFAELHHGPVRRGALRLVTRLGAGRAVIASAIARVRGQISSDEWRSRRRTYGQILSL